MVGQAREGTSNKIGVGRTKDDGAVTVQRKSPGTHAGVHATCVNHSTREMHTTCNQHGTRPANAGRDNVWKNRAPGPHTHGNTARQAMDGLRMELCGQQKQSNDPRNNQHNLNTPATGRR